jgi:hypothetical protein
MASIAIGLMLVTRPTSVLACSPPFEQPTIKALGPAQLVVVGMTGERVAGGRLFHVSRWFNGPAPTTPILIDFKEGTPVGDCSYPMSAGVPLIIAPLMDDGRLSADLVTLQADPASDLGRAYHRGGVTVRARRRAGRGADTCACELGTCRRARHIRSRRRCSRVVSHRLRHLGLRWCRGSGSTAVALACLIAGHARRAGPCELSRDGHAGRFWA